MHFRSGLAGSTHVNQAHTNAGLQQCPDLVTALSHEALFPAFIDGDHNRKTSV
jgi:hypothetical protein